MPAPAVLKGEVDLAKVKNSFVKVVDRMPRGKQFSPCRIRIDGSFVTLRNGKALWRRIGDCKSAIRNHLEGVSYDFVENGRRDKWMERRQAVSWVMENWVGVGPDYPIEIVPVEPSDQNAVLES